MCSFALRGPSVTVTCPSSTSPAIAVRTCSARLAGCLAAALKSKLPVPACRGLGERVFVVSVFDSGPRWGCSMRVPTTRACGRGVASKLGCGAGSCCGRLVDADSRRRLRGSGDERGLPHMHTPCRASSAAVRTTGRVGPCCFVARDRHAVPRSCRVACSGCRWMVGRAKRVRLSGRLGGGVAAARATGRVMPPARRDADIDALPDVLAGCGASTMPRGAVRVAAARECCNGHDGCSSALRGGFVVHGASASAVARASLSSWPRRCAVHARSRLRGTYTCRYGI